MTDRLTRLGVGVVTALYLCALGASLVLFGRFGDLRIDCRVASPDAPGGCLVLEIPPDSQNSSSARPTGALALTSSDIAFTDREIVGQIADTLPRSGAAAVAQFPITRPDFLDRLAVHLLLNLICLILGLVVIMARPGDPAARLLFVASFSYGLQMSSESLWVALPVLGIPSGDIYLVNFVELLATVALLHLFLIFPTPHPLFQRSLRIGPRVVRPLGGLYAVLYLLPPLYMLWPASGLGDLASIADVTATILVVLTVLVMIRSYRTQRTPVARAQIKWILWGLVVALLGLALGPALTTTSEGAIILVPAVVAELLTTVLPITIGLAILHYGLFDINLVIRASVLYAPLAAGLVVLYIAFSYGLSQAAIAVAGPGAQENVTVRILAALGVAALAHPARLRLQTTLDRLVFRHRIARQRLLQDASEEFARAQPAGEVVRFLTGQTVARLELTGAWLALPADLSASLTDEEAPSLLAPSGALLLSLQHLAGPASIGNDDLRGSGIVTIAADDPALAPLYRVGARFVVPLRAAGDPKASQPLRSTEVPPADELTGIWAIGNRRSGELPEREDLVALERIGQQAAVLLDYARLTVQRVEQEVIQRELAHASKIQHLLLPRTTAGWPGRLEIAVRFQPAREMSGDFYDVLSLSSVASAGGDAPIQLAVGDVVGKGIPAALVMALAQTTLRALAEPAWLAPVAEAHSASSVLANPPGTLAPAQILRAASHRLHQDLGEANFVACVLAVVEPIDGGAEGSSGARLRLVNAGQLPPLFCRSGSAVELVPPGERLPVGVLADPDYQELTVELQGGDVVVFSTDGLPEAPAAGDRVAAAGQFFGFGRLAASIRRWAAEADRADAIADGIWSDVVAWTGAAPPADDMTLLVLRVVPHR